MIDDGSWSHKGLEVGLIRKLESFGNSLFWRDRYVYILFKLFCRNDYFSVVLSVIY